MEKEFNEIEKFISEIAGKDTIQILRFIKRRENVSEFKIAEKLDLGINQIRNMLYRLQKHNLISSTRKKDKKKGWYIYYWTFNENEAKKLIEYTNKNRIKNLKKLLQEENEEKFFICPKEHSRFNIESALENQFKCPDCGSVLKEEDNRKTIEAIKKELFYLENGMEVKKVKA